MASKSAYVTVNDYLTIERLVRERPSVLNFEKAVQIFPSSAMFWTGYLDFLLENPERALKVSERAIAVCVHIDIWRRYLSLMKSMERVNVFFPVYEKAISVIGQDCKSADFWTEYLYLIRLVFNYQMLASFNMDHNDDPSRLPPTAFLIPISAPPAVGAFDESMIHPEAIGTILAKPTVAYIRELFQNALSVPMDKLDVIWDDYQAFEQVVANAMGAMAAAIPTMPGVPTPPQAMASIQATKLLAEFSTRWILSKQGLKEISRIYSCVNLYFAPIPLDISSVEILKANILAWRGVLEYEKSNPLKLNFKRFESRMIFVFKQCLMSNCYVSEFWLEFFVWSLATRAESLGGSCVELLETAITKYLPNDVLIRLVIAYVYEETMEYEKASNFFAESLEYFAKKNVITPSLLMHYIRFKARCFSAIHARTLFLTSMSSVHFTADVAIGFANLELRMFANATAAMHVLESAKTKFHPDNSQIEAAIADLSWDTGRQSAVVSETTKYTAEKRLMEVPNILGVDFAKAQKCLKFRNMLPTEKVPARVVENDDVIELVTEDSSLDGGLKRPDPARMQPFRQTAMDYEEGGRVEKLTIPKSLKVLLQVLPTCGSETVPETDSILKVLQTVRLPPISVSTFRRLDEDPQLDQLRREREESSGVLKAGVNLKRLINMEEKGGQDDVIIKSDMFDEDKANRDFLSALASNIHRERVYYKRHKLVAIR